MRRRVLSIGIVAAVLVITSGCSTGSGSRDSQEPSVTTTTPPTDGLPVLFTHTSPDGSTVIARRGVVEVSPENCTTTPPPAPGNCGPGIGPGAGIEFSSTIDGLDHRSVVLDSDPRLGSAETPKVMTPLFGTDDPGTPAGHHLVILHVSPEVAVVRLASSGPGGAVPEGDEMTPVDGWVAFPIHNLDALADPEAFDQAGKSLGTELPFPCC
jgi:hypothetical protein